MLQRGFWFVVFPIGRTGETLKMFALVRIDPICEGGVSKTEMRTDTRLRIEVRVRNRNILAYTCGANKSNLGYGESAGFGAGFFDMHPHVCF